jgi:hypothetical protein
MVIFYLFSILTCLIYYLRFINIFYNINNKKGKYKLHKKKLKYLNIINNN